MGLNLRILNLGLVLTLVPLAQASLVATYTFNNAFSAQQSGVASLTAVDPEGTSQFITANVLGSNRTVYNFNGLADPAQDQEGLAQERLRKHAYPRRGLDDDF